MDRYVIDTHAFLWYLADSAKLSTKARAIFEAADRGENTLIIPAIVLLETIDVLDKKKITKISFDDVLAAVLQASNFTFSEVNISIILEVNNTKGFKDLHDRVVVATAKLYAAPLVSRDKLISTKYPKTIW